MRQREKERIAGLTADTAARSRHTDVDTELTEILSQIDQAKHLGVLRIPKETPRLKKELEKRGFKVEDTGLVWHISWAQKTK